jgi:hypothetical protein
MVKSIGNLFIIFFEYLEEKEKERFIKYIEYLKTHPIAQDRVASRRKSYSKFSSKFYRLYSNWNYSDYFELMKIIDEKRSNFNAKKHTKYYINTIKKDIDKKTNKERNKALINTLIKVFKPILIILGSITALLVGIFIGWLIYKLVLWLISIKHSGWMSFFRVLLKIAAILAISVFYIFISDVIKSSKISLSPVFTTVSKPIKATGRGLSSFFSSIIKGFKFVIRIIKDSCPAIQWQDN